jgi:hypothetical protein
MNDPNFDAARNYGLGSAQYARPSGISMASRLTHFVDAVRGHNSGSGGGLHKDVVDAAGRAAIAIEEVRQRNKNERLAAKHAHAQAIFGQARDLGAEQFRASGKGDVEATFGPKPPAATASPKAASPKPVTGTPRTRTSVAGASPAATARPKAVAPKTEPAADGPVKAAAKRAVGKVAVAAIDSAGATAANAVNKRSEAAKLGHETRRKNRAPGGASPGRNG